MEVFMIMYVKGRTIYAIHDKIYTSEKVALNALARMRKSGRLEGDDWNCFAVTNPSLRKIEGQ